METADEAQLLTFQHCCSSSCSNEHSSSPGLAMISCVEYRSHLTDTLWPSNYNSCLSARQQLLICCRFFSLTIFNPLCYDYKPPFQHPTPAALSVSPALNWFVATDLMPSRCLPVLTATFPSHGSGTNSQPSMFLCLQYSTDWHPAWDTG